MIAAALLLTAAQTGALFPEDTVDATLIILNDDVFTASELDDRVRRLQARFPDAPARDLTVESVDRAFRIMLAWEGFRRFGLEEQPLNERVDQRIGEMIAASGSRAAFAAGIARNGYQSLEQYRRALRDEWVLRLWQNMVLGHEPTPTNGFRHDLEVSPERIRAAYERSLEEFRIEGSVEWVSLQFHSDEDRDGLETAREVAGHLRSGELSLEEAEELASAAIPGEGDPAELNLRPELAEFLADAAPGDVSAATEIPGVGGLCVVVRSRTEDRVVPFAEAQEELRIDLIDERANEVLREAYAELLRTSYLWNVPVLDDLVAKYAGTGETSPSEEL